MGEIPKRIQWHPAFAASLQIEFGEECEKLIFEEEHLLGRKPLQIDVLVIKKKKDTVIHKNIGRIFRQHNIIEYKNPGDNLSVNDFYKVYGYACFYQSESSALHRVVPQELTITFACNRYPKKMIEHLQKCRSMEIVKEGKGIYYLTGDAVPMQLLITNELDPLENRWLQCLRTDIRIEDEFEILLREYEKNRESKLYQAAMNVITRANWKKLKEVKSGMCEALRELMAEEFEENTKQVTQEVTKEVTKEVTRTLASRMKANGVELSVIVNTTQMSEEEIAKL